MKGLLLTGVAGLALTAATATIVNLQNEATTEAIQTASVDKDLNLVAPLQETKASTVILAKVPTTEKNRESLLESLKRKVEHIYDEAEKRGWKAEEKVVATVQNILEAYGG
jgi:hypothetical protein